MDLINNLCRQESLNPLVAVLTQMSFILTLSHLFQLILRPIGQPGPVAHILAGVVSGPSFLSRIAKIRQLLWPPNIEDYYKFFAHVTEVIFMFVIGLEVDISFARSNFRAASSLAYGGLLACALLGAVITPLFIFECGLGGKTLSCTVTTMTLLSTVASPVVIRLAEDFKIDTSDAGRLAITASLINEIISVILYSAFLVVDKASNTWKLLGTVLLTAALVAVNHYLANWYNRWDYHQKYMNRANLVLIMFSVGFAATMVRNMGLSTTIPCFFAGLLFPREGKTARSLLHHLRYFVHVFLLPVYFGYAGFQFTTDGFRSLHTTLTVILFVALNIGGKVVGTLAASHWLNIPKNEGIIIAFVLSLKGHFDLEIIDIDTKDPQKEWTGVFILHRVFVESIVLTTVIAGSVVAFMVRKEESVFANKKTSLELHDPELELRILACVYSPIHTSGALALISALNGPLKPPFTPYLMHLVELPEKKTADSKPKMFHQLSEADQFEEDEEYGGFDVIEINGAIDQFTMETKIFIRYLKAVSYTNTLYEDVCNGAEDKQVSIIFVPFHKHQRIDGKMEADASIIQTTNHKVLRHAPCSVGILVDKAHTGFQQPHGVLSVQHVAALFFSGPDDREALTCSAWMSRHPHVSLTVIRFMQVLNGANVDDAAPPARGNEVLMAMTAHEADYANDNTFMVDFYNRYIVTGKVGYLEKHISSGTETVEILREMQDLYSLFIVGRGGRGDSCITSSLSDWEECPELGTVGDLLASSDFESSGSILVVQKYKSYR